jgi:thiamine pyrophosphate-dependent acetolactate synthase large subunit-like protein
LGMKLAMPDQLVVAVVGDGSFNYLNLAQINGNELRPEQGKQPRG